MRPIDLYRGTNPPCHQFDPYFNPEYQQALGQVDKAEKLLIDYGVPAELLEQYESAQNQLNSTELDLMWCFAFQKGMQFQQNLWVDTRHCDVSVIPNMPTYKKKSSNEEG